MQITSSVRILRRLRLRTARWRRSQMVHQVCNEATFVCSPSPESSENMTLINPNEHKINGGDGGPSTAIKVKVPKRVLHFSDGILEEYSDDEVDDSPKTEEAVIDPSTLTWGPWMWYKAWRAGSNTVAAVDYIGEFMADLFGITTPKYYFELEEYKKRQAEIDAAKEGEKGWSAPSTAASENLQLNDITTSQPQPVDV